jgi:hypothetical protein
MFGCCGFLSFSLVFCRFGGRLETTLYIHFTRRWVEARRHSSASRRKKRERKGGKVRHSSQCRAPGLGGVCGVYQQACPVDGLRLAYDWTSPLWRRAYTASSPLRLCARSLSQPSLRPPQRAYAGRESEQADALCLHKCAATASASLSMRGVRLVEVCVGFDAGLYRWRWLSLLQRLDPPLPLPVESKAKPSASL